MSRPSLDFSFRGLSLLQSQQTISSSVPKKIGVSGVSFSNTSRFQEKKVLRKLQEQQVINRISKGLKSLQENEKSMKAALLFKRVQARKSKREKEN